jgi:hypothetical protein
VARASGLEEAKRTWRAWVAIGSMPIAGLLVTWGYEAAYVSVTGRSFLEVYRSRQVPEGALTTGSPLARTAYSAVWYAARVIWYAFPWSLFAGVLAVSGIKNGGIWPWKGEVGASADECQAGTSSPQTGQVGATRQTGHAGTLRQGAWFATATGLCLMGAFSLAHRKADRYIFVVYFVLAAAGAVTAIRRYGWLQRFVERLDRAWVPAALYVLLFLLRLVSLNALPEFTFWRS